MKLCLRTTWGVASWAHQCIANVQCALQKRQCVHAWPRLDIIVLTLTKDLKDNLVKCICPLSVLSLWHQFGPLYIHFLRIYGSVDLKMSKRYIGPAQLSGTPSHCFSSSSNCYNNIATNFHMVLTYSKSELAFGFIQNLISELARVKLNDILIHTG